MLRYERRPNGLDGRVYGWGMQHGNEAAAAAVSLVRPSVGPRSGRMPSQLEHLDHAVPDDLAPEHLPHGYRLDVSGTRPVELQDRALKLRYLGSLRHAQAVSTSSATVQT